MNVHVNPSESTSGIASPTRALRARSGQASPRCARRPRNLHEPWAHPDHESGCHPEPERSGGEGSHGHRTASMGSFGRLRLPQDDRGSETFRTMTASGQGSVSSRLRRGSFAGRARRRPCGTNNAGRGCWGGRRHSRRSPPFPGARECRTFRCRGQRPGFPRSRERRLDDSGQGQAPLHGRRRCSDDLPRVARTGLSHTAGDLLVLQGFETLAPRSRILSGPCSSHDSCRALSSALPSLLRASGCCHPQRARGLAGAAALRRSDRGR